MPESCCEEASPSAEDLRGMRPVIRLAAALGRLLGRGALLLGELPW
jgi:hypothetical protein